MSTLRRLSAWSVAYALALFFLSTTASADWPRFRGPGGSGTSDEADLPARWSDEEGLRWKVTLPGPGSSSAIVSNGRIFVTCYSGYGEGGGGGGDLAELRRHVVCVDSKSGKLLWDKSFSSTKGEARFEGIGIPRHGYASATPVADGERVFAFFGTAGVVAYDFSGKELWRAAVSEEPRTHNFGTASSPILSDELVIVTASVECEALVAFDKSSGKEAWRAPATGYGAWWGTPVIAEVGDGKELLVSVPGELWGLNPANGKLRWYAETFNDRILCPSVVVEEGVAYAIGGRQGGSAAVRLGGRGDVSKSHVAWTGRAGSYVTSPVVHDAHLYWVNDQGVVYCLDAKTGEEAVETHRLSDSGGVYASALLANDKLYVVTQRNGTFVLEAKPGCKEIAHNVLASDDSIFNGSPAVDSGCLFLRSNRALYCVGKASE